MQEPTSDTTNQQEQEQTLADAEAIAGIAPVTPVSTVAQTEHRQAYGTAKTENLRDNGAYRVILPVIVVLFSITLFAVPLIILIPLFINALAPNAYTHSIYWIFIVLAFIDVGVAVLLIRGLIKIFMTQAGNY